MRKELFRQNSFEDKNVSFAASSVAVNNQNKVIGFLVAKYWQEKDFAVQLNPAIGWIQAVVVDSKYRREGIASQMLEKAELALHEAGVTHILIVRDPWHYFPVIPDTYTAVKRWAEVNGYRAANTDTDLKADIVSVQPSQLPEIDEGTLEVLAKE